MGTWTLWIAFNAGVALLLLLDLGLFHRRAHTISSGCGFLPPMDAAPALSFSRPM